MPLATGWNILSLSIDFLLFALLLFVLYRQSKIRNVTREDLMDAIDEVNKSIETSKRLAVQVGQDIQDASNTIAMRDMVARERATAEQNHDEQVSRSIGKLERQLFGDTPSAKNMGERRRYVLALHKQGQTSAEISRALSLPVTEVDLMLAVMDKE